MDYIGIDISQKYVDEFAEPKMVAAESGVSEREQNAGQLGLWSK